MLNETALQVFTKLKRDTKAPFPLAMASKPANSIRDHTKAVKPFTADKPKRKGRLKIVTRTRKH